MNGSARSVIHALLLDADGAILWRTTGPFWEAYSAEINTHIQKHAQHSP